MANGHAHNMRIHFLAASNMQTNAASPRKRAVNLTIDEALVQQARAYTGNLSATIESLLAGFVVAQQSAQQDRQRAADACAADWNSVHETVGSFADGHSTL